MNASDRERPNVLLFITDQMRADVLGCAGAAVCRTPTLDRLAAEGVRFENAYTATPLCTPARGTLFTGRYPHSHRLVANTQYPETPTPRLPDDERLVSEHFAAVGYRCDYVGKWHLSRGDEAAEAHRRGFTEFGGTQAAYREGLAASGLDPDLGSLGARGRTMVGPRPTMCGTSPLPEEHSYDAFIAHEASALLRRYRSEGPHGPDAPFLLCCSFPGPHFPLEVPAPFAGLYDPSSVPKPASFDDAFIGKPQGQVWHPFLQFAAHLSWPEWQRVIAHYWGYVTYIDALVGRVLATLDELDLTKSTTVLFVADHGEMAGHHRMFDKGPYLYEDVMRVPAIWRHPGRFPPGRVARDGFFSLVDVAPTLCELAGVPNIGPQPFQGRSVAGHLLGRDPTLPGRAFAETNPGDAVNPQLTTRMVRSGRWKYVYRPGDRDELYDLEADPDELVNRVDEEQEVREELLGALREWMRETGDRELAGLRTMESYGRGG